ncbi:MAG: hypothetical protein QXX17_02055 [Conexivisphaerales archaeon]
MRSGESLDIRQQLIHVRERTEHDWLYCYPRADPSCIEERKKELCSLGVEYVRLTGNTRVRGVSVLGKGKNSIVVEGLLGRDKSVVAVKLLRSDSARKDVSWEAEILSRANSVSVGPKLIKAGKHVLILERIYGNSLVDFLNYSPPAQIKLMVKELLSQARLLDAAGIRHMELANASKHVVVEGLKPMIIDFESASLSCRGHNVAALCQYVFIRKRPDLLNLPISLFLEALRRYRHQPTDENYVKLRDMVV